MNCQEFFKHLFECDQCQKALVDTIRGGMPALSELKEQVKAINSLKFVRKEGIVLSIKDKA